MLNEFQEERELLDLKNLQEQVLESGGVAGMLEQLGHRLDLDDLVDWRERASGSETDPTMSLGKLLLLLILSRVEQRDVVDLKVPLLDRFPAQRLQPIAVLLYRRLRSIDHQGTRISANQQRLEEAEMMIMTEHGIKACPGFDHPRICSSRAQPTICFRFPVALMWCICEKHITMRVREEGSRVKEVESSCNYPEDGPSHGDFPVGRRVVEGLDGG